MDEQSSGYYLRASTTTNRRLDESAEADDWDSESYDPSLEPTARVAQIFGTAFERVREPGTGWTLYLRRSAIALDDDDHCRIDIPDGVPLARVRTEVLFDPSLSLDYELLRPEWNGASNWS